MVCPPAPGGCPAALRDRCDAVTPTHATIAARPGSQAKEEGGEAIVKSRAHSERQLSILAIVVAAVACSHSGDARTQSPQGGRLLLAPSAGAVQPTEHYSASTSGQPPSLLPAPEESQFVPIWEDGPPAGNVVDSWRLIRPAAKQ